ncbi:MAG: LysM peptidoglycan-binding domain-containing protein [Candidatus Lambdaproteobacteria bacterium]|nr:LysM peptidoglycan-binding domain-containing protein [Candidatus Lambdaproteobacteria bacterium]
MKPRLVLLGLALLLWSAGHLTDAETAAAQEQAALRSGAGAALLAPATDALSASEDATAGQAAGEDAAATQAPAAAGATPPSRPVQDVAPEAAGTAPAASLPAAADAEEQDNADSEMADAEDDSDDRTLPMTDEAVQAARNGKEPIPVSAALEAALAEAPPTEEGDQEVHFPTSAVIEAQKAVWIRIFAEFSSEQGVIHDGALTAPIYEELDLTGLSRRSQARVVRARKAAVTHNLRSLAQTLERGETPTGEEARLLALFPADVTPDDLRDSAREVRFQRGLADRFKQGLIESGSYLQYIRAILARHGVPSDLGFLPHVESSYNYKAYSKFGAAGIWQFTRGTGKQFMQVQYDVDERLDPLIATRAAAKFLRQNHDRLRTWPLAITAYNHGPNSLESIVARTGTRDLGVLIRTYHGRLFKFASKNFYSEFLAAREVATHYERYFGELALKPPLRFTPVALPFYLSLESAAQTLGLDQAHLEQLNPSLRRPVLLGDKLIPSGFVLRVPHHVQPEEFIAAVPSAERKSRQTRLNQVRVERGDTLYSIGRRLKISWRRIAEANNISRYNRIRPGQRLIIPGMGEAPPGAVAVADANDIVADTIDRAPGAAPGAPTGQAAVVAVAAVESAPAAQGEGVALTAAYHPQGYRGNADDALALQPAEGAPVFPDLDVEAYDAKRRVGIIRSAYGETLGHYADWARVATNEIRALNRLRNGDQLAPGQRMRIPLEQVELDAFNQTRAEYHNSREEDFYSYFGVASLERVKVRRGDTMWSIAQAASVPMWLMYRENPSFIDGRLRAGMQVNVPIVEELSVLKNAGRSASNVETPAASQTAGNLDAPRNAP